MSADPVELGPPLDWMVSAAQTCTFSEEPWALDLRMCGAPAVIHAAILEEPGRVGGVLGCVQHLSVVLRMQSEGEVADVHTVGGLCGIPGTVWIYSTESMEGCCALDESGEEPALKAKEPLGREAR